MYIRYISTSYGRTPAIWFCTTPYRMIYLYAHLFQATQYAHLHYAISQEVNICNIYKVTDCVCGAVNKCWMKSTAGKRTSWASITIFWFMLSKKAKRNQLAIEIRVYSLSHMYVHHRWASQKALVYKIGKQLKRLRTCRNIIYIQQYKHLEYIRNISLFIKLKMYYIMVHSKYYDLLIFK